MSRVSNNIGDAVLSKNGLVKVRGKIVGFWLREDSTEVGHSNTFHFALADSDGPVVSTRYVTKFRADVGEYVRQHSVPPIKLSAEANAHFANQSGHQSDSYKKARAIRKSIGGSHSHITRKLNSAEPLKGKTLELALSIIGDRAPDITTKLKSGQPLNSEEHSYMVDAVLPHSRLG